jgi:predicted RNase H-like HicB family nuclease
LFAPEMREKNWEHRLSIAAA